MHQIREEMRQEARYHTAINPKEDQMQMVKVTQSGGKEVFINPHLVRVITPITQGGAHVSFDKDHGFNGAENAPHVADAIGRSTE